MNFIDMAIAVAMGACIILSTTKGAIRQIFSIFSIVAGYFIASRNYGSVASIFPSQVFPASFSNIFGFVIVFIFFVFIIKFAGKYLEKIFDKLSLGPIDHILGAALGIVKGALLSCIIILILTAFLPSKNPALAESKLCPYVLDVAKKIEALTPGHLMTAFEKKRKALQNFWSEEE